MVSKHFRFLVCLLCVFKFECCNTKSGNTTQLRDAIFTELRESTTFYKQISKQRNRMYDLKNEEKLITFDNSVKSIFNSLLGKKFKSDEKFKKALNDVSTILPEFLSVGWSLAADFSKQNDNDLAKKICWSNRKFKLPLHR